MNKLEKAYYGQAKKIAAEYGVSVELERGSKHPKLKMISPKGEHRKLPFAGSPSCKRSLKNSARDVKKLCVQLVG